MLDDIFDGPYTSAAPGVRAEIHRAMEQLAAIIGEPVDPAPGVHTVGDLAKRLNATGLPWPTVAERGGVEPAAFKRLLEGAPERRLSRPEKRHVGRLFQTPPTDAITAARAAVRAVS